MLLALSSNIYIRELKVICFFYFSDGRCLCALCSCVYSSMSSSALLVKVRWGISINIDPAFVRFFFFFFLRQLNNLLTCCCVCLSGVSGLVHSGFDGAVGACRPGLPAGQVWGQSLRSWAPEEALPRCAPQRPADSASHQAGGHAGSQRPVRRTCRGSGGYLQLMLVFIINLSSDNFLH